MKKAEETAKADKEKAEKEEAEKAAKAEKEKADKEKAKADKAKERAEKAVLRQKKREKTSHILTQIREFHNSRIVADHLRRTNDVLIMVQNTNVDLLDSLTNNLACIFESYLPDLHELRIRVDKENKEKKEQKPDKDKEVITIRPILSKNEVKSRAGKVLSLFKNVTELNDRM